MDAPITAIACGLNNCSNGILSLSNGRLGISNTKLELNGISINYWKKRENLKYFSWFIGKKDPKKEWYYLVLCGYWVRKKNTSQEFILK